MESQNFEDERGQRLFASWLLNEGFRKPFIALFDQAAVPVRK